MASIAELPFERDKMSHVFQTYHPSVAFCYLLAAAVLTMTAMQPVYVVLSLAGAVSCSCVTRGRRATVKSAVWMIPVLSVVTVANTLFVPLGTTELFRLGSLGINLEAIVFGFCSSGMLAAVLLWFASYAVCMTDENTMALFGNIVPVITMITLQIMRLVPQFVARGRLLATVQNVNGAAAASTKREKMQGHFRIVSILMGWGMEDGLIRSDIMRARGFRCAVRRTMYKRQRFTASDGIIIASIILLALVNVPLEWIACSQYQFYPVLSTLVMWWGYMPYFLLMMFPATLYVKEWWQWRSLK